MTLTVASGGLVRANLRDDGPTTTPDRRTVEMVTRGLFAGEVGAWRTRTELVLNPDTHTLTRKTFTIWDPMPSRGLSFVWTPNDPAHAVNGVVSGDGVLEWRRPESPAYDVKGVVARYSGQMGNGRPNGRGVFRDLAGITYDGGWKDGAGDGTGVAQYPNGDEYEGSFHDGVPDGAGRYTDATGETYTGPFVHGLRQGIGQMELADGRTYRSEWSAGVETGPSASARFAAAGPASAAPADLRITLGVAQPRYVTREFEGTQAVDVRSGESGLNVEWFVGSNRPEGFLIRPGSKRLMDMWKGSGNIALAADEETAIYDFGNGKNYGVLSLTSDSLPEVDLAVTVENRSANANSVVGAYLDVAASVTDMQPAIQISALPEEYRGVGCNGVAATSVIANKALTLENFGWGDAYNVELNYAFGKRGAVARRVPDIARALAVPLSDLLKGAGAPSLEQIRARLIDLIKRMPTSSSPAYDGFAAKLKQSGIFGPLSNDVRVEDDEVKLSLNGRLSYDWTDNTGSVHHRTSPFQTDLILFWLPVGAECGEGGTTERVNAKPLTLRNDGSNYRIPVPFRKAVPAGRTGNYIVAIDAKRASQHTFTVVVQLADGRELRSRRVDLLLFRPSH